VVIGLDAELGRGIAMSENIKSFVVFDPYTIVGYLDSFDTENEAQEWLDAALLRDIDGFIGVEVIEREFYLENYA
jgi:hypothetical protein